MIGLKSKHTITMLIAVPIFAAISYVFLFSLIGAEKSHNTLKLVHLVFRHGDRTPTETYPNDPYINYKWPDGWGALTKKGKRQLFNLGKTLNDKYQILIGEEFSPNDVYVKSSDANRCHMSAGTLLAGMFPPTADQIWNPDLLWQPIPIHSLPRNLDNIVAMKKGCVAYDKALRDAYNSPEIIKINEENKELYKYLTLYTGQSITNITDVEFLFNTLEIEYMNGLELPEWTKSVYPKKLKPLAARSLSIFTETSFMRKMKGGVLLSEMINNIKYIQSNLASGPKFFLYSAHDISLTNLLRTIGFVEDMKPDYGAAFVLEAHADTSNDIEIQMLYFNSSEAVTPYILHLNSCGDPCKFDKFINVTKQVIPQNWEEECNNSNFV